MYPHDPYSLHQLPEDHRELRGALTKLREFISQRQQTATCDESPRALSIRAIAPSDLTGLAETLIERGESVEDARQQLLTAHRARYPELQPTPKGTPLTTTRTRTLDDVSDRGIADVLGCDSIDLSSTPPRERLERELCDRQARAAANRAIDRGDVPELKGVSDDMLLRAICG